MPARIFLYFLLLIPLMGQLNAPEQIRNLISTAYEAYKSSPMPNPIEGQAIEDLRTLPQFNNLANHSNEIFKIALENIKFVAPNSESRDILFHSFEELSPENYLSFINQAFTLFEEKEISKDEFIGLIYLPSNKKMWFLSYNYRDTRVIAFLERIKKYFSKDPRMNESVDFILSGKAKERDEILRKKNPYYAKQSIPLLSGSISGEASSPMISQTNSTTQPAVAASTPQVPLVAPNLVKSSPGWLLVGGIALAVLLAGMLAWKFFRK